MSQSAAAGVFDEHAGDYDALRRRLVPDYEAFYGAVTAVLTHLDGPVERVLDLGAGTGLVSAQVLAAFPAARLELLDGSELMLAQARGRLGEAVAAVHVADLAAPLPPGPFDAVVSGLAIHHLEHPDQRSLLARSLERLRPGGVFINAEQIAAGSLELEATYELHWTQDCRALGATETELADARRRMLHDRCATTAQALEWLAEAGFAGADCVYKRWRFAVLAGWRST